MLMVEMITKKKPNNAKMQLIKVMTTEAEKKKKVELGTKIRSWRETKADMKKKLEALKPEIKNDI